MDGPDKPGHDKLTLELVKLHYLDPLPSAREGRASPRMTVENKKPAGLSRGRKNRQ